MKKQFLTTSLLLLFTSSLASAKCLIKPENIARVSAGIKWQNEYGEEDNTALIRADFKTSKENKKSVTVVDYEAFVRPDRNEAFQPLPIPLFLVHMDKKHDAVYICAHMDDSDESENLTIVYFLRNNQISPVTPMPLPIRQLGKLIWGPIENTPLIVTKIPLSALARIQTIVMHMFSDLTRIGIDRVRITSKKIELYSGGDPTQFKSYVLRKEIPLE